MRHGSFRVLALAVFFFALAVPALGTSIAQPHPMKAVICGAGIAGLALAARLAKLPAAELECLDRAATLIETLVRSEED